MKAFIEDSRGSVLILVAWIFAIIGIIAGFLLNRSEVEWAAVVNLERSNIARQLAEEILQERLALLRLDDTETDNMADAWFAKNGFLQYERDGFQVTVTIEDESSKPNLNLLEPEELQYLNLDGEQIEPVLDWIDPDDEVRPAGAEADFYQSAAPAYQPRNGFLATLREVLAVKDGPAIYPELAPYCTVFGKYNLNTLTEPQLENLLLSLGFNRSRAEQLVNDVRAYRSQEAFTNLDQLRESSSISLSEWEKLFPLLTLNGIININFISEAGLKMILKKAGYNPDLSKEIINRRQTEPFNDISEAQPFFNRVAKPIKVDRYFATVSTIIRYQIWLSKGKHTYYLDTIQERVPDDGEDKWRVYPLSRCLLLNREAPELPEAPLDAAAESEE